MEEKDVGRGQGEKERETGERDTRREEGAGWYPAHRVGA